MHLGTSVVPDEYMMYRGWLNGSCSKVNSGVTSPAPSLARKSARKQLEENGDLANAGKID